jgi:Xaa-Pro aminopeptidase
MMRLVALAAALCPLAAAVSLSEFAARRAKLRASLDGAPALLLGRTEKEAAEDRSGFFQEPNFYYLTGVTVPGAALLLTPEGDRLYLPRRDAKTELWYGHRLAFEDPEAGRLTGLAIRPADRLEADVQALDPAPLRLTDATLAKAIARLRMTKSPAEIELIRRAIDAGIAAHRAAWEAIAPGRFEYEIAAHMTAASARLGCERNAYPPIVGSGPNALVLHYAANRRRMDAGDLVVVDFGPECGLYASDITRTLPVSGKFTPRQRELYEAVLEAQRAVIEAAKPGVPVKALKQVARDAFDARGRSLGRYLPHGVSHHVGLEVHDAADEDLPLAPGAVITVEPGLYIPEEKLGVRVEDMILITENGAEVLTSALPAGVEALERAMAQAKR